ncbi:MAG: sigma 54 modulation protein/ribosomal protein [Firmicutes bacterium]|nr:sigma 54 modulation protein/ribosomal protein [Bacillota bacterium]
MAINVRGKNLDITPALKDYVEKRVKKVTKYFDKTGDISVILRVEKGRHQVEVTVPVDGILLRGEESTPDMYASIDQVMDKLEKQIEKHKTKLEKRFRGSGFRADVASSVAVPDVEEETLVRSKRFAVKPMDSEEAILQMNLLNHDFFMFLNIESEQVNLVYRRKDGHYGLLEPEF